MMTQDELERVKRYLLNENGFRDFFVKQNSVKDQRMVIHNYIQYEFGDDARERSLVSERTTLAEYFQNYFSNATLGTSAIPTTQEQDMSTSTPAIETKTYIYGNLAANVSDDQIFGQVAGLEQQIEQLSKAQNKSKKLEAKIAALQADIAALNDFVDARP
jgi:hypothetical protein